MNYLLPFTVWQLTNNNYWNGFNENLDDKWLSVKIFVTVNGMINKNLQNVYKIKICDCKIKLSTKMTLI